MSYANVQSVKGPKYTTRNDKMNVSCVNVTKLSIHSVHNVLNRDIFPKAVSGNHRAQLSNRQHGYDNRKEPHLH